MFRSFYIWGLVDPKASQIPQESKKCTQRVWFSNANQSVDYTPSHLLYEFLHSLSSLPSSPASPEPGIRQLGVLFCPHSSLQSCGIADYKPVYPVPPSLPQEITRKAFVHRHSPSLLPSHGILPFFRTVHSEQCFWWQLSPDLWVLPYSSSEIYHRQLF